MLRRLLPCWGALLLAVLPAVAAPNPPAGAAAGLGFARDPARFRAKEAQFVAALRQQSPAGAAALEQLFARDVLAAMRPELSRLGLDSEDVVDMTALYWIAAWEAANDIVGRKTDPAIARAVRARLAAILLANPAMQTMPGPDRQDIADTMLLQAIIAAGRMEAAARAGPEPRARMSDAIRSEAQQLLHVDMRQLTMTAAGVGPAAAAGTAAAAGVPPTRAAPPAAAGRTANWASVEGVYFRLATGFGVGGMATIDYRPLILFRDGSYYAVDGDALEDLDLGLLRRTKPARFGRWSRTAGGFALTDSSGRTSEARLQGGKFFKAFPAEALGGRLSGTYRRLSGGGNTAYGGDVMAAARNQLVFSPDGRFSHSASSGGTSSGGWTGVGVTTTSRTGPAAGSYRIERYTITLTDRNGGVRRQFFAVGSKNSPPQPDPAMIFVGDRVFTARK